MAPARLESARTVALAIQPVPLDASGTRRGSKELGSVSVFDRISVSEQIGMRNSHQPPMQLLSGEILFA